MDSFIRLTCFSATFVVATCTFSWLGQSLDGYQVSWLLPLTSFSITKIGVKILIALPWLFAIVTLPKLFMVATLAALVEALYLASTMSQLAGISLSVGPASLTVLKAFATGAAAMGTVMIVQAARRRSVKKQPEQRSPLW